MPRSPAEVGDLRLATLAAFVAVVLSLSSGLTYTGPNAYAFMPFYAIQGLAIVLCTIAIDIAPSSEVTRFRVVRLVVISIASAWLLLTTVGPFAWGVL